MVLKALQKGSTLMATRRTEPAISVGQTILAVDGQRTAGDPYKLPPTLRNDLQTRLTALIDLSSAQKLAESTRSGGSGRYQSAIVALEALLRDGYNHVARLASYELTETERTAAFLAYGWTGGKLGSLEADERVRSLARTAVAVTASVQPAVARYPQPLLDRIAAQLAILDESETTKQIGSREAKTRARNEALAALNLAITRVRFHYSAATDLIDKTPELARIGLQPRRVSGQRLVESEKPTTP